MSARALVVALAAAAVRKIRNRPKAVARRAAKAARKAARQHPLDEIDEPFFQQEDSSMNSVFATQIVLALLRHAMTALAPLGIVASDDWLMQTAAIVVGLAGLGWSFLRKRKS